MLALLPVLVRTATVAALVGWMVLITALDRAGSLAVLGTLVAFAAAAAGIVSDPRAGVRRALLGAASAAFADALDTFDTACDNFPPID